MPKKSSGHFSPTRKESECLSRVETKQELPLPLCSKHRETVGEVRVRETGYTHRRARRTLETGEATVALYASVTLFACLTLVTTGTLGSLKESRRQAVG